MTALSLANHLLFAVGLFAVSTVLTWLMLRIGIMAIPNQRSSHRWPIPNGGGVAIVLTFLIGLGTAYLVKKDVGIGEANLLGFVTAAIGISLISLADDLGRVRTFKLKLTAQIVAALILVGFDIVFHRMSVPGVGTIDLGWWGYPITFVWVVAMTNVFNFMDGLNGLAGGCAVLVALFYALVSFVGGSDFVYIICYILLASLLGFLIFNFPQARIFMGDVGSQFLGFGFAAIAVIAAEYDNSSVSALVMPLLFFNFIFDAVFTIVRRLLAGQNIVEAHRGHLYQLFNQLGATHFQVSLFHYGMAVLQGVGALWLIQLPPEHRGAAFLPFLLIQSLYAAVVLRRARRADLPEARRRQ